LGCTPTIIDETAGQKGQLLEVQYDGLGQFLKVTVHPSLKPGQTLHVQVRPGPVGTLNCFSDAGTIPRIDMMPAPGGKGSSFRGPFVDINLFGSPYNLSWLEGEPSLGMIEAIKATEYTIELCLMEGGNVIRNEEMDIDRALDSAGTGKFDGYEDGENIASPVAYAEACIHQLGEIPFFPRLGDGDYDTFSCLDATPIPTVVTDENGNVSYPDTRVSECDNPQFIYSMCEPNADPGRTNGPRVTSAQNDQGTHWILLCRKSIDEEGKYNDMAMLGHNPYTGRTCFFQNALYSRTDGLHVTHPADKIDSPASPYQSEHIWRGIEGGLGSGIQCADCHDADPIIHTPWIDGAKNAQGETVVPKMGTHDGLVQGYNDAPYTLVNAAGQGWSMHKHLTSEEAAPCTKCHRIGSGRWAQSWIKRMEATDSHWDGLLTPEGKKFENYYWMPPEMENIDEESWPESEFGRATTFLLNCADNMSDPGCRWEDLPTEAIADFGEVPEVELTGTELALESLKILGATVTDPSDPRCDGPNGECQNRRCSECHSLSKGGLKHWKKLTKTAQTKCKLTKDPEEMSVDEALTSVQCLRAEPTEANSVFAADKLGILTTGVRYGYFRELFRKAYGDSNWLKEYVSFKSRVHMPKGTYAALSQSEHAILMKWFEYDLASMTDHLIDPPPPESCEPYLDSMFMNEHVDTIQYDGWGATNKENGIWMYGCPPAGPAGSPSGSCLTDLPDRTAEWGNGGDKGTLRQLAQLGFRTSFWTRSSADGRFVANGGGNGFGSTITDLQRGIDIGVKSSYDPGFFPDNSGFIYQGGGAGTRICTQSMLETVTAVDYDDPGCMKGTGINLYQHVARGLNGGDYFIINSQFTSDSGGSGKKNPVANFNVGSTMKFTPMVFNGTAFEQLSAVIIDSPFEGDSVLSPSGRLVISRLAGGEDNQSLGYVIRQVETSKFGDNYLVNVNKVVARVCTVGAKANISFDERFFVTHSYEEGRSDIILVDLLKGQQYQVTNMPEGTRALFPHFRSDGWFYFLVKGKSGDPEYVVASDLALLLQ